MVFILQIKLEYFEFIYLSNLEHGPVS